MNDSHLVLEMEQFEDKDKPEHDGHMYGVCLYVITVILLYADQNLMAPNLSQIAQEFGFSDVERDRKLGGDISFAFFILGLPASWILGCCADSCNRMILTALTIGLGEGACLATYFVHTYQQLYLCRAATGLSIGGALPLMYSVLGDWFRAEDRHAVAAVVGIGTGVGATLGQGLAGFIGPRLGWRLPFLIVGLPALLCAMLLGCTVNDPQRGAMECETSVQDEEFQDLNSNRPEPLTMQSNNVVSQAKSFGGSKYERISTECKRHGETLLCLLSTKTYILALLQGAPGCVPWGIVNTFLIDFLSRDRGMTVENATLTVLFFGFGSFIGLVMSGTFGRILYRQNPRYPPLFAGLMTIMGCLPFWILLNYVDFSTPMIYRMAICVFAGVGSGATGPIVKATVQNVTMPNSRGQAFAVLNTFDDFGRGLGPVFIAHLIMQFGQRTKAFNIGVLGWILCGIFNSCMYFFVENDERSIYSKLSAANAEQYSIRRMSECSVVHSSLEIS
jgi:MFS family permease